MALGCLDVGVLGGGRDYSEGVIGRWNMGRKHGQAAWGEKRPLGELHSLWEGCWD